MATLPSRFGMSSTEYDAPIEGVCMFGVVVWLFYLTPPETFFLLFYTQAFRVRSEETF